MIKPSQNKDLLQEQNSSTNKMRIIKEKEEGFSSNTSQQKFNQEDRKIPQNIEMFDQKKNSDEDNQLKLNFNSISKKKVQHQKKCIKVPLKFEIFVKSLVQPLVFWIFFYQDSLSGDIEFILPPLICFMFGGILNIFLVLVGHWTLVFISAHSILMEASLFFSIIGNQSETIDLEMDEKHEKMAMAFMYFLILLTTKIDLKSNFQKGMICLLTLCIGACYQILFFKSVSNLIAFGFFSGFSMYSIWNFQRLLEEMNVKKEQEVNNEKNQKLEFQKNKFQLYKAILKDGIRDCTFFATLEGIDQFSSSQDYSSETTASGPPRLIFVEKNGKMQESFSQSTGFDTFLQKMILTRKDQITAIQEKIAKILKEPYPTPLEGILRRFSSPFSKMRGNQSNFPNVYQSFQRNSNCSPFNQSHSKGPFNQSNNFLNSNDQIYQDSPTNQRFPVPLLSVFENSSWNLKQLSSFVSSIRLAQKSSNFNEQEFCSQPRVNHFNLQELIALSFFQVKRSQKKKKEQRNQAFIQPLKLLRKDLEFRYLSTLYTIQLFSCLLKDQDSLFISMTKLTSSNQKIAFPISPESNQSEISTVDSTTAQFLDFFKNRSEKIQKAITNSLCRLDCLGGKEYQQLPQDPEKSKLFKFLEKNCEYMRIIAKDTEEYREYLDDQIKFKEKGDLMSGLDRTKFQQRNLSRFRFSQIIEEVKEIFQMEVAFKSTQISLVSERYLTQDQSLKTQNNNEDNENYSNNEEKYDDNPATFDKNFKIQPEDESEMLNDYEKIKRVLIILIENSLIYQKAGTIEIEVIEETPNVICIKLIDNQTMNSFDKQIEYINKNGQSEQGYGFAIASALLQVLKPKNMTQNPLFIRKDSQNDKINVVFYLAKILKEDNPQQGIITLQQFPKQDIQSTRHIDEQNKIEQSGGIINLSIQQKAIDNMIIKQMNDFNELSKTPNNIQQQQQKSYANSTNLIPLPSDKPSHLYAQLQKKIRKILSQNPSPASFQNIYFKSIHRIKSISQDRQPQQSQTTALVNALIGIAPPKSNPQINSINQSAFNVWGKGGSYINNQPQKPQFLIVSQDFRISASLSQLLMIMSGDQSSVKFSSNKFSFKEQLSKQMFEYILIDSIEGMTTKDLFVEINFCYKHRKQVQKIIFFDYSGPYQRNLETQFPLLASQDLNQHPIIASSNTHREDFKPEQLKLNPSQFAFPGNRIKTDHKIIIDGQDIQKKEDNNNRLKKNDLSIDLSQENLSVPTESNFDKPTAKYVIHRTIDNCNNNNSDLCVSPFSDRQENNMSKNTSRYEQNDSRSELRYQFPLLQFQPQPQEQHQQPFQPNPDTSHNFIDGSKPLIISTVQNEFTYYRQGSNIKSQDGIKASFVPNYNESVEVASNLKFAYYSLDHPFGYAQILEGIFHLHFAHDLLSLNNNFFNLNKPELYFSSLS